MKEWPARISRAIKQNTQVQDKIKHSVSQHINKDIHKVAHQVIFLLSVYLDNVLQVQDLLLIRKATGHAGLPGPTVKQGNVPGHAVAT